MNTNHAPLSVSYQEIYAHVTEIIQTSIRKKEIDQLAFQCVTHDDRLEQILATLQPIDFRTIAGLNDKEKIPPSIYYVIVIDQVIKQTQKNNSGLCQREGYTYVYTGQYWKRLQKGEVLQFLSKAAERLGVNEVRSKDHLFQDNLYKQFVASSDFSSPKPKVGYTLVNLKNYTLSILNGEIRVKPFEASDSLTYQLPFEYDPQAQCPRFQSFLNEVLPQKELQKVLAEFIGWIFIPASFLKLEKCLILYGSGANGKSVFFDIISALLGSENITSFSLRNLCEPNGQYRARLASKLLNYTSELSVGLESDIFKQLASGEPIEARQLYKEPYMLKNYARLAFNANELPRQVEQSDGFFRRFIIIPFEVTIPKEKQDPQLAQKIIADELPGILNWVLEAQQRLLLQKGFTESESVLMETEKFRRDTDSTAMFLQEEGYIRDPHEHITLKELYYNYEHYCQECRLKPVSRNNFAKRLEAQGVVIKRTSKGQEAYLKKQPDSEAKS